MSPKPTVLFVCLHGAAKSVLAAADFERLAAARGAPLGAAAAGVEPDPAVSPAVARLLLAEGVDVRGQQPRQVTADDLRAAWRVVSFGCDLRNVAPEVPVLRWDEVPAVGDEPSRARAAIAARLPELLPS